MHKITLFCLLLWINMHVSPSFIQIFYTWLLMQNSLFIHFKLIIVNY